MLLEMYWFFEDWEECEENMQWLNEIIVPSSLFGWMHWDIKHC